MILFPAIDLKDGLAVRLQQGDIDRATVFNRDPAAQAHTFETQGFRHLHVVDLDGAFAGKPMNAAAVDRILETVGLCVQLGGGIRDMATIEGWLGKGVNRVIIGTAAVRNPALAHAIAVAEQRIDVLFAERIDDLVAHFGLTPRFRSTEIVETLLVLWRGLALRDNGDSGSLPVAEIFITCMRAMLGRPQ